MCLYTYVCMCICMCMCLCVYVYVSVMCMCLKVQPIRMPAWVSWTHQKYFSHGQTTLYQCQLCVLVYVFICFWIVVIFRNVYLYAAVRLRINLLRINLSAPHRRRARWTGSPSERMNLSQRYVRGMCSSKIEFVALLVIFCVVSARVDLYLYFIVNIYWVAGRHTYTESPVSTHGYMQQRFKEMMMWSLPQYQTDNAIIGQADTDTRAPSQSTDPYFPKTIGHERRWRRGDERFH